MLTRSVLTSFHVAHAFAKLHVTRRAEAAVRFTMPHAAVSALPHSGRWRNGSVLGKTA